MLQPKPIEVKNPQAPPKNTPVEAKIPEKYLEPINEVKTKRENLIKSFLQLSVNLVNLQTQQKEVMDKINNTNESLGAKIENAFTKMKLNKRKNFQWTYNEKGTFIGTPKPEAEGKK